MRDLATAEPAQYHQLRPVAASLTHAIRRVNQPILIVYAEQSRFPLTFQVIGGLLFASGVVLTLLSRDRFARLVRWSLDRFAPFVRPAALVSPLFGGFLIYAAV